MTTTPTVPTTTIDRPPLMRPKIAESTRPEQDASSWLAKTCCHLLCLLCLGAPVGCARPAPEAPARTEERRALVPARPLAAHIPAVGLRWLVELKPSALMSHPEFRKDWEPVFASEGIRAFTQASGADPAQIETAWIAGYDLGELYLFDGRNVGNEAQAAFEARSLSTLPVPSEFENLHHLTGIIEQTPRALVHIDKHLVALAVGDIRLARIVRAYAEGKLKRTPPALESRFLSIHAPFAPDALVRGFLRGPYESATDAVAASFVSGVAAVRFDKGELQVSAQALGVWPLGADLESQLTRYADQLLSTRELRILGWGFPTQAPRVSCAAAEDDLALCTSKGAWDSASVAAALHRVTAGSMKEIVDETPTGWHPEATTEGPSDPPNLGAEDSATNKEERP